MIPEYLENLVKEYALVETEFQDFYHTQLVAEYGGDPFNPKPFYEKIFAETMTTYKEKFGPGLAENFADFLRKSIDYLRELLLVLKKA